MASFLSLAAGHAPDVPEAERKEGTVTEVRVATRLLGTSLGTLAALMAGAGRKRSKAATSGYMAANAGLVLQTFTQEIDQLIGRNHGVAFVTTPLVFQFTVIQASVADNHAVRNTNQFLIGELDARTQVAIV